VEALAVRDELAAIYRQHRQGLYSLALSIIRQPQLAEDAVHDAFVRLIRREQMPQGDPVAYIFAAVRNAAIDLRRRGQPGQLAQRENPAEQSIFDNRPDTRPNGQNVSSDPAASLLADEQQRQLQDALEQLPQPQRDAVVMRIYGELTFDQIAQITEEPLSTIASRYQRALTKLRDVLEHVSP